MYRITYTDGTNDSTGKLKREHYDLPTLADCYEMAESLLNAELYIGAIYKVFGDNTTRKIVQFTHD